jgi:hypothetical protein
MPAIAAWPGRDASTLASGNQQRLHLCGFHVRLSRDRFLSIICRLPLVNVCGSSDRWWLTRAQIRTSWPLSSCAPLTCHQLLHSYSLTVHGGWCRRTPALHTGMQTGLQLMAWPPVSSLEAEVPHRLCIKACPSCASLCSIACFDMCRHCVLLIAIICIADAIAGASASIDATNFAYSRSGSNKLESAATNTFLFLGLSVFSSVLHLLYTINEDAVHMVVMRFFESVRQSIHGTKMAAKSSAETSVQMVCRPCVQHASQRCDALWERNTCAPRPRQWHIVPHSLAGQERQGRHTQRHRC